MVTTSSDIRTLADFMPADDGDPKELALQTLRAAWEGADNDDELFGLILPAVTMYVAARIRHVSRQAEHSVESDTVDPADYTPPAPAERKGSRFASRHTKRHRSGAPAVSRNVGSWLDRYFAVDGTGERVTWGEATIEQHRRRSEYLRKKVTGYNVTISKHDRAADLIAASGAERLSDLESIDFDLDGVED